MSYWQKFTQTDLWNRIENQETDSTYMKSGFLTMLAMQSSEKTKNNSNNKNYLFSMHGAESIKYLEWKKEKNVKWKVDHYLKSQAQINSSKTVDLNVKA